MNKEHERVLAYTLATSIDQDALNSIAGGQQGAAALTCSTETVKASGFDGRGVDVAVDVRVDW